MIIMMINDVDDNINSYNNDNNIMMMMIDGNNNNNDDDNCSVILYSRIWLAAITNCSWLIATAWYRSVIILWEYDDER